VAVRKHLESEEMTIMDAVDNLSSIAEVDIESEVQGIQRGVKEKLQTFKTLKPAEKQETLDTVKGSFKTIHKYLKHVYQKEKEHLQDAEMQRSVKAIMALAGEAADKLENCTSLFKHTYKQGKIEEIKEYQDLRKFYLNKLVKRFQEVLITEEAWEEEWGVKEETVNIKRLGLKDLETVKRDKNYELFHIRKEDGQPFFNRNLLRHIKLVSDFDEMIATFEGEDPLLRISGLVDQEAQVAADEIRVSVKDELADFYAEAAHHQDVPIIKLMNKVMMALLMGSNPRNLLQHTEGKACVRYFHDFHTLLREILTSSDYTRLMSHSLKEADKLSRSLLYLLHALCFAFFTSVSRRKPFIDYIYDLTEQGKGKSKDPLTFWNDLLEIHDTLSAILKKHPGGPLFKTLDTFRERGEKEGFDPLYQGNLPAFQFTFSSESFDSKCLRLPCPTRHEHINHAEIVHEFKGFLSHLSHKKELGAHLLFNLQDRTSSEESARCLALEGLSNQLILVTLPKQTEFYFQTASYRDENSASAFLKLIKEQVASNEGCGFFFSSQIVRKELDAFIKKVLPLIHKRVFDAKGRLTRPERLDFIEIFYQLLMLKVLDLVKPDFFSFTCKDAVDVGATTSAGFASMIKMMSKNRDYSKEEQEHLLWTLYRPALIVRERLVDHQRLSRVLSAMVALSEGFQKDQKGLLKDLEALYDYPLFQKLQIKQ